MSELGKRKYNLIFTNCEHFVNWARYGSKSSLQVGVSGFMGVGDGDWSSIFGIDEFRWTPLVKAVASMMGIGVLACCE